MKKILYSFLLASGLGILYGAAPDCQYSFKFTNRATDQTDGVTQISGANPAIAINNKDNACAGWQLSYDSEGFSAISLNLQSAPNVVNAPNVISQGSWSTFSGTAVTGSLPLTNISQGLYIGYAYFPWIRVNLTSLTGTGSINVKLQGWKSVAYVAGLSSGGGGGGSGNCPGSGNAGDIQKYVDSTHCGSSALNDTGTNIVSTEPIQSANGFQSGNGSTPGLDSDLCGTAPSTPASGIVYGFCNTSNIPQWKDPIGNIYEPVIGIANPSDSQYVSYIDAAGVAHRSTPSGGGGGTVLDTVRFQACGTNPTGNPNSFWEIMTTGVVANGFGGSATNPCGLIFNNSGTAEVRIYFPLSANWTSTISLTFETESVNSGVVNTLSVKTACAGNGGTWLGPTYNTAQTLNFTANASANVITTGTISTLTTTGCAAGNTLIIDIIKSDTNAAMSVVGAIIAASHT